MSLWTRFGISQGHISIAIQLIMQHCMLDLYFVTDSSFFANHNDHVLTLIKNKTHMKKPL